MQRAFVTGAAGFVGSHLSRHLLDAGFEVHISVLPGTDLSRLSAVQDRLVIHTLDLQSAKDVVRLMHEVRPQHVFHLAASLVASGVISSAEDVTGVNILGTKHLLDAGLDVGLQSFVLTGSFLEYGPQERPLVESDRCEPLEIYGVSKLAATLLAQGYARAHGLPAIVARLFTPYGPQMQKGRLVRELIERALAGEPLLLTSPNVARDFVYVDDICRLLIDMSARANELRGEVFNAGSGQKTTLEELVSLILQRTGSTSLPSWGARGKVSYDSDLLQADMTKTFKTFAWRPEISLEAGIERTVASLRSG